MLLYENKPVYILQTWGINNYSAEILLASLFFVVIMCKLVCFGDLGSKYHNFCHFVLNVHTTNKYIF